MTFSEIASLVFVSLWIIGAIMTIIVGIMFIKKMTALYGQSNIFLIMGISIAFSLSIAAFGIWLAPQMTRMTPSLQVGSWICAASALLDPIGIIGFLLFGDAAMEWYQKQI
jgi:hypothetical protein